MFPNEYKLIWIVINFISPVQIRKLVSLISSSLGYIESTYEGNWLLLIDETSSRYRSVELKATARDFFFSCRNFRIHFVWYEYKNRSSNKGAQFVPMRFPTDCRKTWPPTTKILLIRNSSIFFNSTLEYLCRVWSWNQREEMFFVDLSLDMIISSSLICSRNSYRWYQKV
jgi:hypothetical protein